MKPCKPPDRSVDPSAGFAERMIHRYDEERDEMGRAKLWLPVGPRTDALLKAIENETNESIARWSEARLASQSRRDMGKTGLDRQPTHAPSAPAIRRKPGELDVDEEAQQLQARAEEDERSGDPDQVAIYPVEEPLRLIRDATASSSDLEVRERKRSLYLKLKDLGHRRACGRPDLETAARIEALRTTQPHFGPVIDLVLGRIALATARCAPLALPPLLLLGEPGVGKTHFSRQMATQLGLPLHRQALDSGTTDSCLMGADKHWGNSTWGLVFEQVCLGKAANPIILLDEIDKATQVDRRSPLAPLHSLLEPLTAARVRDISVDLEFDASHVTWIATANDVNLIPPALRSRFTAFEIVAPTGAEALQTAEGVAAGVHEQMRLEAFEPPPRQVLVRLAHLHAREQVKALHAAYATAVRAGRHRLGLSDLPTDLMQDDPDSQTPGPPVGRLH